MRKRDNKIYISVCKQTIARNKKLPHEKRVGPLRISTGRHGKPSRIWGFGMSDAAYVAVIFDETDPLPSGAKAWVQITPRDKVRPRGSPTASPTT